MALRDDLLLETTNDGEIIANHDKWAGIVQVK